MTRLLYKILRFSGLPFLFRELIQKNKVTIILFHNISKETAEKSFIYLKKKYNIIDLNFFIDAIEKKEEYKIPKKALIITFDDGHVSNYELLPIIKKYNIPLTIFLCASIINTRRQFWFEFQNNISIKYHLKQKTDAERLKILHDMGFEQEKEFDVQQALDRLQIDEMKSYINLQSHTMFHPILTQCDNVKSKTEIFKSKKILENDFNLNINAISYPNGNYSKREILFSQKAGYRCGITVDYGFNTIKTNSFKLKRLNTGDLDDINGLIVRVSGVWGFFRFNLLKGKKWFKKVGGLNIRLSGSREIIKE